MATKKILDKNIDSSNYASFKNCLITHNGRQLVFVFACGASYDVPLEYILKWFSKPHYMVLNGKIKSWDDTKNTPVSQKAKVLKCRKVLHRTAIRIYLSNNTAYDVFWDTVLMACEKTYQHFGGLTKESKEIVNSWHKKA